MTVQERLSQLFPAAKRTTLKTMVQTGRVRLNAPDGPALRRLAEPLPDGADLAVLPQAPEPPRHRKGELDIRFEDDHLLVVSKPPGLLTATTPHEKRPTLLAKVVAYIERHSPRGRAGLIHRLDKDARGLLVFSKHDVAYQSLKDQLKDRSLGREYHAIVLGTPRPGSGTIQNRLIENEVEGNVRSTTNARKGEVAITHYRTVQTRRGVKGQPELSLVHVRLETGRKHQIRVHLSELGFPILGDPMYGRPPHNRPPLYLAATSLAFIHPVTRKPMTFSLDLPPDFTALINAQPAGAAPSAPPTPPPTPPAGQAGVPRSPANSQSAEPEVPSAPPTAHPTPPATQTTAPTTTTTSAPRTAPHANHPPRTARKPSSKPPRRAARGPNPRKPRPS